MPKAVVFYALDNLKLLDLTGPLQVFSDANKFLSKSRQYDLKIVTSAQFSENITTDTGISITATPLDIEKKFSIDTLIVVGGEGPRLSSQDAELVSELANVAKRARRIASVCTGAFMLAATGLLNHRKAVTHWMHCHELQNRYPKIKLEIDPIYIRDGKIWTSAGVTSGIDLALAMVAEDHGRPLSIKVAKVLVTFMLRPGGQSQCSQMLDSQTKDNEGSFDELRQWVQENLEYKLPVEILADKMGMSLRTFIRRFTSAVGTPPARYVSRIRVERAIEMLEHTDMPIKTVAYKCGFKNSETMRRSFRKHTKIPPLEYRNRF